MKTLKNITAIALMSLTLMFTTPPVHAQFILSAIYNAQETTHESWAPTDLSSNTEFDLIINWGNWPKVNTFGMYLLDPNNDIESSLQILGDNNKRSGDVIWDNSTNTVSTNFGTLDYHNAIVNTSYELGFYFNDHNETFFSHSILNDNNVSHFGLYRNTSPFSAFDVVIWADNSNHGSWRDGYVLSANNMTLGGELSQVPLPSSVAMFGILLLGFIIKCGYRKTKY